MTTIYGRILDFRYEGNQWEPEAITFPEKPRFDFKKRLYSLNQLGEKLTLKELKLGQFCYLERLLADNMEEISEKEFNDAMRNFTEELIKDGGARSVLTSWLD